MPWNLVYDVQQTTGSKVDTGVTVNTGQWIAAWIDPWSALQVDPWGVLHISAALPLISGVAPVLDHKLLYAKLEAYYGSPGIGSGGRVFLYIRDDYKPVSVAVRVYKFS